MSQSGISEIAKHLTNTYTSIGKLNNNCVSGKYRGEMKQDSRQDRQKEKVQVILPQLNDRGGDVTKKWYVSYSFRNPETDKMTRFRVYQGFSERRTVQAKRMYGRHLVKTITEKIRKGWSPYDHSEKIMYADYLQYVAEARRSGSDQESSNGVFLKSGNRKIEILVNKFLTKCKQNVRPSTFTSYKSKFRYFMDFLDREGLDKMAVTSFTQQDAQRFNEYLVNTQNQRFNKCKRANKTINQYNILLRSFFKYAIDQGYAVVNPFSKIKKLNEQTNRPRIYDQEIIRKIISWAQEHDPQLALSIRLIYNCFIRPGELRQLRIRHIDWVNSTINIPGEVAKMRLHRVVAVPGYLLAQLEERFRGKYPEDYFIISSRKEPHFVMQSRNTLYNDFVRAKKALGIPRDFILYAFKHTGMVDLRRNGADWYAIRNQAGHRSLDQTIAYTKSLMGENIEYIRDNAPKI